MITVHETTYIEVLPFCIPPGRCKTWEMGGSQFTMTLWMGYSQTPEIENGNASAGWRQVPDPTMTEHGVYVPGHPFAIFIQVSNKGRNGCIKS